MGRYEIILVAVILAITVFWIWMLVSAAQNKGLSASERIAWVLVVVFLHLLGAILYFFIAYPKRLRPVGSG